MRRFKMLIFSEPAPGQEEAFNAWYTNRHLPDMCALPGIASGQRYKLYREYVGKAPNGYLAIYDVEADDPDWVIQNLFAKSGTPELEASTTFKMDTFSMMLFEECSGVVEGRPAQ